MSLKYIVFQYALYKTVTWYYSQIQSAAVLLARSKNLKGHEENYITRIVMQLKSLEPTYELSD